MSEKSQSALRNPWVLFWISIPLTVVIVNVTMIILSLDRPGLVVDNYYERGRDYERNMLSRMAKDPGWEQRIEAPRFVDVNVPAPFHFRVTDQEGEPVTPDEVIFRAYRPADARADFEVPMQKIEPGMFSADITFPLLGVWDILVSTVSGEDEFNTAYRLSAGVR